MLTIPKVELLCQDLASGRSPVELYENYLKAIVVIAPAMSDEELVQVKAELRARIAFAWGLARAKSIELGQRAPVKYVPPAAQGDN